MVVLSEGRVFTAGPPGEIATGEVFREVFSVEAEILPDPRLGVPLCIS
jgi:iron complex transport system ATP-binding protein